jgi:glycosyltransferase involved in cell wall biosynthesis
MPVKIAAPSSEALEWLCESVRSVFVDGIPLELVIVDDGSSFPISDLMQKNFPYLMKRGKIRVHRFERSVGLIRALNFALEKATAPVIARLDADDLWLEGSLVRRYELLKATPSCAMVFGGMLLKEENGKKIAEIRDFDRSAIIRHGGHGLCGIPHCSVLVYRDALRAIGGYEFSVVSQHTEDFATWSNFVRFFDVRASGAIEYVYRLHPDSVSARNAAQQRSNTETIARRFEFLEEGKALEDYLVRRRDVDLTCDWNTGLVLARAWAEGGSFPHYGARDAIELLFYDRPVHFEGDVAIVAPMIV